MSDLWREFIMSGICGLCGNTGTIDTRGRAITCAGLDRGGVFYCICLNGEAMKGRMPRLVAPIMRKVEK